MAEGKVITGTVIEISVTPKYEGNSGSVVIGRAMALNIQEQYRVTPVYGIGNLTAQELPILQYAGGFSVQQFAVSRSALENLMGQFRRRGTTAQLSTVEQFKNHLLYTDGVDVTVFRKEKGANGQIQQVPLAKITNAVCTGETMGIQENQIVIRNGEFVFADPVQV